MLTVAAIVLAVAVAERLLARRGTLSGGRLAAGWLAVAALLVSAAALSPGDFELRKFVGACLMPAGLVWLGLLALAVALWRRGQPRFACVALLLWVGHTLAGNVWLGDAMLGWLQKRDGSAAQGAGGTYDAVLVLGGGIDASEEGRPRFAEGGDRVVEAVRLFRAGRALLLLTSGPPVRLSDGRITSYPALTAELWEQLGIPRENILEVVGPKSTTDEVVALKRLIAEHEWRRVGLVTSAWHMPRALRLCRRYGVQVTPLPADEHGTEGVKLRYVVPQWLGFQSVQLACWEMLGMLAGR